MSCIETLRAKRNLSQGEVAERAGISQETLSRLENHHREMSMPTAKKLAAAFGLSLVQFLQTIEELEKEGKPSMAIIAS